METSYSGSPFKELAPFIEHNSISIVSNMSDLHQKPCLKSIWRMHCNFLSPLLDFDERSTTETFRLVPNHTRR